MLLALAVVMYLSSCGAISQFSLSLWPLAGACFDVIINFGLFLDYLTAVVSCIVR